MWGNHKTTFKIFILSTFFERIEREYFYTYISKTMTTVYQSLELSKDY